MKFAVGDDIIYILEYMKRIGVVGFLLNQRFEETAAVAGMAGRSDLMLLLPGSCRCHSQESRDLTYWKWPDVSPLSPELLAAAAPVCHFSCC